MTPEEWGWVVLVRLLVTVVALAALVLLIARLT